METIGHPLLFAISLLVLGYASEPVGWSFLENYGWFQNYIKFSKGRRIAAHLFMVTLGLPLSMVVFIISVFLAFVFFACDLIKVLRS